MTPVIRFSDADDQIFSSFRNTKWINKIFIAIGNGTYSYTQVFRTKILDGPIVIIMIIIIITIIIIIIMIMWSHRSCQTKKLSPCPEFQTEKLPTEAPHWSKKLSFW